MEKFSSLVCGEALIDLIPCFGQNGEMLYSVHAGGSPYNVAIAMARLGISTAWLGRLSIDGNGAILRDKLQRAGVRQSFIQTGSEPQALSCVYQPSDQSGDVAYSFYFAETCEAKLDPQLIPDTLPQTVEHLHFGSISAVLAPGCEIFTSLRERECHNRLITYDPNIRPSIMATSDKVRPQVEKIISTSDLVKASDGDCAWLYPGRGISDSATHWLKLGAKVVIITQGARGVSVFIGNKRQSMPSKATAIVDTVGSGDSFMGALLGYLQNKGALNKQASNDWSMSLIDASANYGQQAAAITMSRAGADPPWDAEMGVSYR